MPRPPSPRLRAVEEELRQRLRLGHHLPGSRFLSNRALAERYEISLQSSHNILNRLCEDGLLERRAASGTYIPDSGQRVLQGALLVFNPRARRRESFGHYLHARIQERLRSEDVEVESTFDFPDLQQFPPDRFLIFWEVPDSFFEAWPSHRFGLILHRDPPLGMAAAWLDSIAIDDLSGGVMAAQVLKKQLPADSRVVLVSGPEEDPRSRQRVAGFQKVYPQAKLIVSSGWYRQHGRAVADQVFALKPDAVFCCNDRLAEGLMGNPRRPAKFPTLLGFDNAPVARELNLSTIAIPWDDFVENTLQITRQRLKGSTSPASRRILTPRPILREGFELNRSG